MKYRYTKTIKDKTIHTSLLQKEIETKHLCSHELEYCITEVAIGPKVFLFHQFFPNIQKFLQLLLPNDFHQKVDIATDDLNI